MNDISMLACHVHSRELPRRVRMSQTNLHKHWHLGEFPGYMGRCWSHSGTGYSWEDVCCVGTNSQCTPEHRTKQRWSVIQCECYYQNTKHCNGSMVRLLIKGILDHSLRLPFPHYCPPFLPAEEHMCLHVRCTCSCPSLSTLGPHSTGSWCWKISLQGTGPAWPLAG